MLQDGLYHHIDAANVRGVEKPDSKQKSLSMQCEKEKFQGLELELEGLFSRTESQMW